MGDLNPSRRGNGNGNVFRAKGVVIKTRTVQLKIRTQRQRSNVNG